MAKKYDKESLIVEYKTGVYTQRQLADKHSISVGMVSRITKHIEKEDVDLVNARVASNIAMSQKSKQEVNIIDEIVNELSKDALMISRLTNNNMVGLDKKLLNHGKMELVDHKHAQDAIDKASITLGVNPRFSTTPLVTNNNTNAQQNNSNLTEQDINDQLAQFEQRR